MMNDIAVLFVDDDQFILDALARNLRKEPYRRHFAASARQALEILEKQEIHIVVCDLRMPEIDGLTFLKQVKELYPETVRIVLTGFIEVSNIVNCINTGEIYRYVLKPIDPKAFRQTLHDAIQYYLLRRDRQELIDRLEQRNRELEAALTELKKNELHLRRLSLLDGLTKVPNRRNFNRIIRQEWLRARRNHTPITLLMLDIDNFSAYNNAFGHPAGDACLRRVAKAIKAELKRPGDMLARYGGEEFAVILPETDTAGATFMAEAIRRAVESLGITHATEATHAVVTVSVGGATLVPTPHAPVDHAELIELADRELYAAKSQGKNRVSLVVIGA